MIRKGLAVLIFLLFIETSIIPFGISQQNLGRKIITVDDESGEEKYQVFLNGNNYSFHGNASSDSNWYVVKFSCDKPMILGNGHINIRALQNRTQRHSAVGYRLLLTNFKTIVHSDGGLLIGASTSDFYLQVDAGRFDFTINRLDNRTTNALGVGGIFPYPWDNRNLSSGDWYLIIYTNHDGTVMVNPNTGEIITGKIEVFINLSSEGNVTFFTPTEGCSNIYYESQDFHGNIVHKRPKLYLPFLLNSDKDFRSRSIIRDGKAQFVINNTFIGNFFPTYGWTFGHDNFQLTTPQGKELNLDTTDVFGHIVINQGDFNHGDCIVGGNGTWKLDVDQIGFGNTPFVCFMGVDILLPNTVLKSSSVPQEMILQSTGNIFLFNQSLHPCVFY